MLGAAQFMVHFQEMHFNAKKALYINIKKHASIFHEEMLSTINGGGHGRCYVLPTSICATTNYYFPIEDIYSGIIFQYALANILNVTLRFIKSLHQPKKLHRIFDMFTNRNKENK